MVTEAQRKRPRPWALALGMIACAIVPLLAVAALASGGGSADADCADVARQDTDLVRRAVIDTLAPNSLREVKTSSDYDEACALGAVEVHAAWAQTTGATIVRALQTQGWTVVDTGMDDPDWFAADTGPTGAAGTTADNDSPNMVLTKTVENRPIDLGVDTEGLHVVLARAGGM